VQLATKTSSQHGTEVSFIPLLLGCVTSICHRQ